jgi:membrane-anchored glycerophosphoryl diester phosphodiesterase (GDPDase)
MFPKYAYAYLDPATGAMIINGLVVGFITLVAFFRRQLSRLLVFMGLKEEQPSEDTEKSETSVASEENDDKK